MEEVISQLSLQNQQLQIYESIDIDEGEKAIRRQFNLSREDITYKDFQELSREQLKVLFNYLIDNIEIKELDFLDNKKIVLLITIHLKLDGYAPKQTLEYLKNIRFSDNEKRQDISKKENDLSFGGGEGPQPNQDVKPNPTIHYIPYEIVEERTKEYLEIK